MAFTKWLEALDPGFAMQCGNYFDKFIKERLKRF
jgi:hypothetical protein